MILKFLTALLLITLSFAIRSAARSEEVFIGNPGKSLNGCAIGKGVDFPPQRLVDYNLLREVQQELGMQ